MTRVSKRPKQGTNEQKSSFHHIYGTKTPRWVCFLALGGFSRPPLAKTARSSGFWLLQNTFAAYLAPKNFSSCFNCKTSKCIAQPIRQRATARPLLLRAADWTGPISKKDSHLKNKFPTRTPANDTALLSACGLS